MYSYAMKNYQRSALVSAILVVVFLIVSYSPFSGMVKFVFMSLISAAALFVSAVRVYQSGKMAVGLFVALLILFFLIMHLQIRPPANEYGKDKSIYMLFVIITAGAMSCVLYQPGGGGKEIGKALALGLIVFGAIYSLYAVLGPKDSLNARRIEDGLNPLILARVAVVGFFACVYLLLEKKRNLIIYTFLLFFVATILLTGSRGPLVACFITLFFVFLLLKGGVGAVVFIVAILVVFLLFPMYSELLPAQFVERVSGDRIYYQLYAYGENDRLGLYSLAIDIIKEKPVLGSGVGGFSIYNEIIVSPHNIVLELLSEIGVLLGGMFLILFFAAGKKLGAALKWGGLPRLMALVFLSNIILMQVGGEMTIQSFLLYLSAFYLVSWSGRECIGSCFQGDEARLPSTS